MKRIASTKLSSGPWGLAILALCGLAAASLPAQTLITERSFSTGKIPASALLQDTNGDLYGTTFREPGPGADGSAGTLFKLTFGATITTEPGVATIYSFCSQANCMDGQEPMGVLVQAANGDLYGTTVLGGANAGPSSNNGAGGGTIFKFTNGTLTRLYSFCAIADCADGYQPYGGLTQATNGDLYGTTFAGGTNGDGTVFKITPAGALTTIYSFCSQANCADGENPYAGVIQATNGDLYGTTYKGGLNGGGTIFKITPAGALTTIYSFCSQANCADGENPYAGVIQARNGYLYGTTVNGGANASGTVFQITLAGKLTRLHSFCAKKACADGQFPYGGLVQATDTNLYGTTEQGGAYVGITGEGHPNPYGAGTIFKITPSGTLTTLYNFCAQAGCPDGAAPSVGLMQDTNGYFYGTTTLGGTNEFGMGTLFRLSVGLNPFVKTQPTSGAVGKVIEILGTDLTGVTRVTFNGTIAAFSVVSSSLVKATVPVGATSGTVEVETPGGTIESFVPFTVP